MNTYSLDEVLNVIKRYLPYNLNIKNQDLADIFNKSNKVFENYSLKCSDDFNNFLKTKYNAYIKNNSDDDALSLIFVLSIHKKIIDEIKQQLLSENNKFEFMNDSLSNIDKKNYVKGCLLDIFDNSLYDSEDYVKNIIEIVILFCSCFEMVQGIDFDIDSIKEKVELLDKKDIKEFLAVQISDLIYEKIIIKDKNNDQDSSENETKIVKFEDAQDILGLKYKAKNNTINNINSDDYDKNNIKNMSFNEIIDEINKSSSRLKEIHKELKKMVERYKDLSEEKDRIESYTEELFAVIKKMD